MYRVQCVKICTSIYGEMNYADFRCKLLQNAGRPAIVNVNIGQYFSPRSFTSKNNLNLFYI